LRHRAQIWSYLGIGRPPKTTPQLFSSPFYAMLP
jgi:hypothetical protein